MKRVITLLVILLFVMAGCGSGKQSDTQNDGFITVDVTAKYPKKDLILQDFLDVEYISLETSDEFVTSAQILTIDKESMFFKNMQRGTGDIFVFDRTGKGLRKINRSGQGNEEYLSITGIVLDKENDELFVNNHHDNKILVYDQFGNFKRKFIRTGVFHYSNIGNFDQDNLICLDGHFVGYNEPNKEELKKNYFSIMSKNDGSIKEIQIPYKEKKQLYIADAAANGTIIRIITSIWNNELIPYKNSWILTEFSADTIYIYSQDHSMKPFIVRTPSVQSMNPEVFLSPGVLTDRYYFMHTVKKIYDSETESGFSSTDIMYDRQENAIFECVVYNDDFTNKRSISLSYEINFGNNEIAFIKKFEAIELVEAYEKGELKGKLKEIASKLDEESNAVIMLAKYRNKK